MNKRVAIFICLQEKYFRNCLKSPQTRFNKNSRVLTRAKAEVWAFSIFFLKKTRLCSNICKYSVGQHDRGLHARMAGNAFILWRIPSYGELS